MMRPIKYQNARRVLRKFPGWAKLSVLIVTAFIFFVGVNANLVHADSQGPLSASSTSDCVDDNTGTIGTVTWTNPGNAFSVNTTYATASVDGTTSHYIKCTNFGFSITSGSTINGIVVSVTRKSNSTSNGGSQDAAMRIVKGGTVGTTDKSTTTTYTTSDVSEDHGSSSDLWGTTWTTSDTNASTFGAAIAVKKASAAGAAHTVSVDAVRITVYYTLPPTAYNQASYRLFNNSDASGATSFVNAWGTSGNDDEGYSIANTSDGGYALAGYTSSYGAGGGGDVFLTKYDAAGNVVWTKTWGGSFADGDATTVRLTTTSDGGYAICGRTSSFSVSNFGIFVLKLDSSGSVAWSNKWDGSLDDEANAISPTADGGLIVAGYTTSSPSAGNADVLLLKYNASGVLTWQKIWGGTAYDVADSVIQTSDGGYAVTGETASFGVGSGDAFLLKYDSSGTLSWNKTWGGNGTDEGMSLVQTSDGGYAIAGHTNTTAFSAGNDDAFLLKYDSSGTLSWNKTWGGTAADIARSLVQTSDGGYAIAGYESSFGNGGSDSFLLKYDSSGTLSWNKTWGQSQNDKAYSMTQTSDGGYVLGGESESIVTFSFYVLLEKYDSAGAIANCSSDCTSPSATVSTPTATVNTPSATTNTPSVTLASVSGSTASPTVSITSVEAISPTDIDVGSTLAALNTSATVAGDGQPFRLRIDVGITADSLSVDESSLKLQYAERSGTCDTGFSGETYLDVTDTSTVRYYDNTNAVNGLLPHTNANDPTDGGNTLRRQTYQESGSGNFTNPVSVAVNEDGLWDFALTTDHTIAGTHYCLRLEKSNNTGLDTYTNIPEIITPSSTFTQSSYRIFNAGSAATTFSKAWGGTTQDYGYAVAATSDGGYAMAGGTTSFGTSGEAYIVRYDSSGTVTWNKRWGSTQGEQFYSVAQTSDGGFIATGSTASFGTGIDMFITKFDSSGNLTWNKNWGGSSVDVGNCVIQTSDGGYAVTGNTQSFGAGNTDVFIVKYDSSGTVTWNKTWGASSDDYGQAIVQTSDGGYAVTGQTVSLGTGNNDAFLAKYDSSGTLSWSKTLGSINSTHTYGVVQTSDGGYAISGAYFNPVNALGYVLLAKYDSSGNLSWAKAIDATVADDIGFGLVQSSDGGYVITGHSDDSFSTDELLVKVSSSGVAQWGRLWGVGGGTQDEVGNWVAQTTDGGYVTSGFTANFGVGSINANINKWDASGNINGCSTTCTKVNLRVSSLSGLSDLSVSATVGTPSATVGTPSATVASPSATTTTITALANSASVGSALVGQNTPYDPYRVTNQFRLRLLLDISGSGAAASGQAFKLKYALRDSDQVCNNNETYADVDATTPVYYYNSSSNASGDGVHWSANDPTSGTNVLSPQTYVEDNTTTFTNAMTPVYAGESGEWDFSLAIKSGTQPGNVYCLKVVKSSGSDLDSYSQIVDIAYGPTMPNLMRQEAWWNRSGVRQNFFIKGQ